MNTARGQAFKDYFAPTMKLAVNGHASKYAPLHHMALAAPARYQVASMPPNKRAWLVLIALLHLFVLVGIIKNVQQNPDATIEIAPMLVNLISATKPKVIEAPAVPKTQAKTVPSAQPKPAAPNAEPKPATPKPQPAVEQHVPVTTQEASALLANEAPEVKRSPAEPVAAKPVAAEPVAEKAPSPTIEPVQSPKQAEQKVEPEIAFEPPSFNADYLHNPAPEYPGMARRRGEQGRITLKVVVNTNGDAQSVQLDKSSGFELLDQAAIDAVKGWKFVPAKKNNQPVSGTVIVPVRFSLDS